MILLILFLAVFIFLALSAACTTPFDILRSRTEDLSETLYVRASFREPWLTIIPRDKYPMGAGYVRSSFQVGRSEPSTDEESWAAVQSVADNSAGACNQNYNQTYTGFHEDTYKPEAFDLMGPLVCQDDLTMYWKSQEFWEKYFQALEKRNRKSIINRIGNVYRNYVPKASANASFQYVAGNTSTQPSPSAVDLSGLIASLPDSELTQEMLDGTAVELMEEGADEPNSNGWITQGADGPQFPLLIGSFMSQRILQNNSEFRSDLNQSFQGWGETNPVIKRLGASRIIKNYRHIVNRFPARWRLMSDGETINYASTGPDRNTNVIITATLVVSGAVGTITFGGPVGTGTTTVIASAGKAFVRIPTFANADTSVSSITTKGRVAVVNGAWRDPAGAPYESVEVLNPWVMTEEVLMPVNSAPGMKLNPQNYFGEWQFVTGNDALLGISGCTGVNDPLKKYGRHFANYKHALKPIFPLYGRLILFQRCPSSYDRVTCS